MNEEGKTYEGEYFKLDNDTDLDSSQQLIPIGNEMTYFQGMFDGNGNITSLNSRGLEVLLDIMDLKEMLKIMKF